MAGQPKLAEYVKIVYYRMYLRSAVAEVNAFDVGALPLFIFVLPSY
jgi:hypothetical protein